MLAYDYPLGGVLVSVFWIVIWVLWIMLLWHIFGDIFRSDDLGGGGKAAWTLFVVFLPFLGVFVYLLVRGRSMAERSAADAVARDAQFQTYVKQAAGTSGPGDQLTQLVALRDAGQISPAEFEAGKAKILG